MVIKELSIYYIISATDWPIDKKSGYIYNRINTFIWDKACSCYIPTFSLGSFLILENLIRLEFQNRNTTPRLM